MGKNEEIWAILVNSNKRDRDGVYFAGPGFLTKNRKYMVFIFHRSSLYLHLRIPSLRGFVILSKLARAGNALYASDGLWRVANGKHSIAAWKEVCSELSEQELKECQENWLTFTEGLQVQLVHFPDHDITDIKLHMGVARDLESSSNRFRQTSLESKFEIFEAARAKVPGLVVGG